MYKLPVQTKMINNTASTAENLSTNIVLAVSYYKIKYQLLIVNMFSSSITTSEIVAAVPLYLLTLICDKEKNRDNNRLRLSRHMDEVMDTNICSLVLIDSVIILF